MAKERGRQREPVKQNRQWKGKIDSPRVKGRGVRETETETEIDRYMERER